LARVGIIALIGFGIGIVWPWLAGVRFVPDAPGNDDDESAAVAAEASGAPSASVAAPEPEPAEPAPPRRTTQEQVKIGDPIVVSCRDERGRKSTKCDEIDFASVAHDKLLALAQCPAAKGASKILSIGFDIDFEKNTIREIEKGKSTTFPSRKTKELLACAEKEFASIDLSGIAHEKPRYSIFFLTEFVPAGTMIEGEGEEEEQTVEASGLATVRWDVALVRDAPEDGDVKARLRYGTRVEVAARRGKWYLVEFDGKGTKGWVHENAIGL
jgi:hypothetical protein